MKKILNYGSLNLDCVFELPHIVNPGETLGSYSYQVYPGGKGANQSIAIARAGGKVFHGGKIGQDGIFFKDIFQKDEIDTTYLCLDEKSASGRAVIQVDRNSGENAIILFPGTNHEINSKEIKTALQGFSSGDWLVLQNEITHIDELIQLGSAAGLQVVFNPAPMTSNITAMSLEKLALLIVNEHESASLCREKDPEKAIYLLRKMSPNAEVIITLGKAGAILLTEDKLLRQTGFKMESVVDTTGAGDTFVGSYVALRADGASAEKALRYASAAAALSVTKHGAIPSIPYARDVEAFLAQRN